MQAALAASPGTSAVLISDDGDGGVVNERFDFATATKSALGTDSYRKIPFVINDSGEAIQYYNDDGPLLIKKKVYPGADFSSSAVIRASSSYNFTTLADAYIDGDSVYALDVGALGSMTLIADNAYAAFNPTYISMSLSLFKQVKSLVHRDGVFYVLCRGVDNLDRIVSFTRDGESSLDTVLNFQANQRMNGLAFDPTYQLFFSVDSTSQQFAEVDIKNSFQVNWTNMPIGVAGVSKMIFGSDKYLYWTNTNGFYRTKDFVNVELLAEGNYLFFGLDLKNTTDYLAKLAAPVLVPDGSGRLWTAPFQKVTGDFRSCLAEVQSGSTGVLFNRVGDNCTFAISAPTTGGPFTTQNSVKIVASDSRGGLDTIVYQFNRATLDQTTISPMIQTNENYETLVETTRTYNLINMTSSKVNLDVVTVDNNYNTTSSYADGYCATGTDTYMAQSFTVTAGQKLMNIKMSMGYTSGAILKLIPDNGNFDRLATPIHVQYIPGSVASVGLREYLLDSIVSFPSAGKYWIVLEDLDGGTNYRCTMALEPNEEYLASSGTQGGNDVFMDVLYVRDLPDWMKYTKTNTGGILTMIPGPNQTGTQMQMYFLLGSDSPSSMLTSSFNFSAPAVYPAYPGGLDTVMIGMSLSQQSPSVMIPNWLKESAIGPRTYQTEIIDYSTSPVSSAFINPDGSLSLYPKPGRSGAAKLRSKRCYTNVTGASTDCSTWDTSLVIIATPPSVITSNVPANMKANTNKSVALTVSDVDADHLAKATVNLFSEAVVEDRTAGVATTTVTGSFAVAQNFQPRTSSWVSGLQLQGKITADTVTVVLREHSMLNYFAMDRQNSASERIRFKYHPSAKTAMAHILSFPKPIYMNAFSAYSWEILADSSKSDSVFLDLFTSTDPGSAYLGKLSIASGPMVSYGSLSGTTNQSFSYSLLGPSKAPAWASLAFAGKSPATLTLNPTQSEVGNHRLILQTWDGYSQGGAVVAITILPPDINYTRGADPMVAMSPSARFVNLSGWVNMTSISPTCTWETEIMPKTVDTTFLNGVTPQIVSTGDLSFYVGASQYGVGRFRMRVVCGTASSPWDTVTVTSKRAPVIAGSISDSVATGTTTTKVVTITDPDAGDASKLSAVVNTMKLLVKQDKIPELQKGMQVNQSIQMPDSGELARIQIYGNFPTTTLRVSVFNESQQRQGLGMPFEGYTTIAQNTLGWHSISLPPSFKCKKGDTLMLSISIESPVANAEGMWGVSTANPYADGSGYIMGASGSPTPPNLDLGFQLWVRGKAPSFAKVIRDSKNLVTGIQYTPSQADTGAYSLMLTATDGAAASATYGTLTVYARDTSIVPTQSKLRVVARTEGQSIRLSLRNGNYSDVPKGGALKVYLMGKGYDTSATLLSDADAWLMAKTDSCRLDWYVKRADGSVAASGDTTLTGLMQSWKEPAHQQWIMVGLGPTKDKLDMVSKTALLFRWDESVSGITGQYVSRANIQSVQEGAGYWYLSNNSQDTLAILPRTDLAQSTEISLWNKGSGWNMISNPWNWTIALDTNHEYWSFDRKIGGYVPVSKLGPNMAVWVNVENEMSMILNPFPVGKDTLPLARKTLAKVQSTENWISQVKLVSGTVSDIWNFFGVSNGLEENAEPPAGLGEYVSLAFQGDNHLLARKLGKTAEWKLVLSADRMRNGELQFSGISELNKLGTSLVIEFSNGQVQEIPASGKIAVTLAKGKSYATIRAVPVNRAYALQGGLQNLRWSVQGHSLQLNFEAPLVMEGRKAQIELVSVHGKIYEQTTLSALQAGQNSATFGLPHHVSGAAMLIIRCGSSILHEKVVLP